MNTLVPECNVLIWCDSPKLVQQVLDSVRRDVAFHSMVLWNSTLSEGEEVAPFLWHFVSA